VSASPAVTAVPPPTARPHEATAAIPSAGLAHHLRELVRPYPVRLVAVGLLVLVAAVLEVAPPLVVRHVIDSDLTRGDTAGLGVAAVLYLAAATGVAAASAAYGYLAATVAQRSLAALRTRLFAHLLVLPMSYHDRTPRGNRSRVRPPTSTPSTTCSPPRWPPSSARSCGWPPSRSP
jgi:ABC-type multidrug transport system fused ATPase/permease subunit